MTDQNFKRLNNFEILIFIAVCDAGGTTQMSRGVLGSSKNSRN